MGYYVSDNGQSNFHIYLWIIKDLAWAQNWYWVAHIVGGAALLWQLYFFTKSALNRNLDDAWFNSTVFMWLLGHYLWMDGELHDYRFPNKESTYDARTIQSGYIFIAASIWVSLYYIVMKPLRLANYVSYCLKIDVYQSEKVTWRFPFYFQSWKEYENIHSLFWLLKDTGWNWWVPSMVVIFFVPTFLLSIDFVWITLWDRKMLVDHAHYLAQLVWLCSASAWAAGEFFLTPNHDDPIGLLNFSLEARITSRWYASWMLVLAFVPIVVLHMIWIPATVRGMVPPRSYGMVKDHSKGNSIVEPDISLKEPLVSDVLHD